MQRKTLYLIDGNSYSYRAHYALGQLRTSYGRATGAVYGFLTMLNKLRAERKPDYVAVCFDVKEATFRHERYADYKIHRKPMPEELIEQMPVIKELIAAYGIPLFERAGFEADDVIATLAVGLKERADIFIVSADKDMLQLVDPYVKIYNPQQKPSVIDAAGVVLRHGVNPEQIPDLIALAGDNSDNIPGVPGIGPKTAVALIHQFGSLENLLAGISAISQEKRREAVAQFADQARLCKDLARLKTDVALAIRLEDLAFQPADYDHLRQRFAELEFRHLVRALPAAIEPADPESLRGRPCGEEISRVWQRIVSAQELIIQASAAESDSVVELCAADSCAETGLLIPLADQYQLGRLRQALAGNAVKIGYDLKTIMVLLARRGIRMAGPFFDVMVAAYLLEPSTGTRSFTDIVSEFCGTAVTPRQRSTVTADLARRLRQAIDESELGRLCDDIEMPLLSVLADMEFAGITVDAAVLRDLDRYLTARREELTQRIYSLSGSTFNINSPQQLADVLFHTLGLPVIKKGRSGPSTDAAVLSQLATLHELPAVVIEYRELTKLQGTFVQGLLQIIDTTGGRVHTSLNQAVTATGRLSSRNPNLQNIPVRTDTGRRIRAAFISRETGWQLLSADYSQIELRILAHLSQDANLMQAFIEDRDVHTYTASLICNVAQEEVTRQQRDLAKRVNFGIMYGMGPFGLARDLNVPVAQAKQFIDEYFVRYPGVQVFVQQQIEKCRRDGYVTTLFKRRRAVPDIQATDPGRRAFAERVIMNTPIQGTAADMIKAAMVEIDRRLRKHHLRAQMVLQVHDELVFDVPDGEIGTLCRLVSDGMEHVVTLSVPVRVSVKVGPNWRDMREYDKGGGTCG